MMSSKDGRMSNILRRMYLWNGWCPGENDQLFDTDLQHTAINVRRSEQFVLAWAAGGEPRERSEPVGSAERGRAAAPAPGRSACGVVHRRGRGLPAGGQGPGQVRDAPRSPGRWCAGDRRRGGAWLFAGGVPPGGRVVLRIGHVG